MDSLSVEYERKVLNRADIKNEDSDSLSRLLTAHGNGDTLKEEVSVLNIEGYEDLWEDFVLFMNTND